MKEEAFPKAMASGLVIAGFTATELQLYPNYTVYPYYMGELAWTLNVEAAFALVCGGLAVACLLPLLSGHEAGGGVSAAVIGWLAFVYFFAAGQAWFAAPWLAVLGGGLFGILAHAIRSHRRSRRWTPG